MKQQPQQRQVCVRSAAHLYISLQLPTSPEEGMMNLVMQSLRQWLWSRATSLHRYSRWLMINTSQLPLAASVTYCIQAE
jgi:hypothetical protein